jgi:hypothetical protein
MPRLPFVILNNLRKLPRIKHPPHIQSRLDPSLHTVENLLRIILLFLNLSIGLLLASRARRSMSFGVVAGLLYGGLDGVELRVVGVAGCVCGVVELHTSVVSGRSVRYIEGGADVGVV